MSSGIKDDVFWFGRTLLEIVTRKIHYDPNCPHEYRIQTGPMNGAPYHLCKRCQR